MKQNLILASIITVIGSMSLAATQIKCKAQIANRCDNPSVITLVAKYSSSTGELTYKINNKGGGCFPVESTTTGLGLETSNSDSIKKFKLTDQTRKFQGLPDTNITPSEQVHSALTLDLVNHYAELTSTNSVKVPMQCVIVN